ncbi:MAG: hypothetical protein ACJAUL_003306, partial [Paraglaciecola sp.]
MPISPCATYIQGAGCEVSGFLHLADKRFKQAL